MVEPLGGVVGAASLEAGLRSCMMFLPDYSLSWRPFEQGQVGWAYHWSPAVGTTKRREGLPCNNGSVTR